MRPARLSRLLLVASLLFGPPAHADMVVIVHPANPVGTLDRAAVADLYRGRNSQFPDGTHALVFDLAGSQLDRERFFTLLNGMSIARLNTYWSRLMFGGQMQPPTRLPDTATMLSVVGNNRGAIGYVDAGAVDDRVRVVLRLAEE